MLSIAGCAAPAAAQRLPFERAVDVGAAPVLDVSTIRGKIEIVAGEPGRVLIEGSVTVRFGLDVPRNAVDLARGVAAQPPIELDADTVRLRPPSGDAERRAVTVAYRVRVPVDTTVVTVSDSGATRVQGVTGSVNVKTGSSAIELTRLGGAASIVTGSGAVLIDDVAGDVRVKTGSSAFTGRALRGGLHARSGSGAIRAELTGAGEVDVETSSSAISLLGATGGLTVSTQSGRVAIGGVPGRAWTVSTGSGSVQVVLDRAASLDLEATNRSGSIQIAAGPLAGSVSKRRVAGSIGGGGPLLRLTSRSGSIRVEHASSH